MIDVYRTAYPLPCPGCGLPMWLSTATMYLDTHTYIGPACSPDCLDAVDPRHTDPPLRRSRPLPEPPATLEYPSR